MSADSPTARPAVAPSGATHPPLTKKVVWSLVGVLLTAFLSALDQTVVSVAAYPIATSLDPDNGVQLMPWLITTYMLGSSVTQPLYGKIADLYGAKKIFIVSTVIFLVASALCGAAQTIGQLIAFRVMQGIGAGGLYSVALILLARAVPPRERAKFQGMAGLIIALATVTGPLIGGYLTGDHNFLGIETSWRWIFYVNLPIGIAGIAMVISLLDLPPVRRGSHRVDYLGALLVMAGSTLVLLTCNWGGDRYAWSDPLIIALGAGGLVLLLAFVWWESRASEPLMPLRVFRERTVAVASPMLFVVGFALMGAITYAALYLQLVRGYSSTATGLRLMPMILGILIASIGSGIVISNRNGRYKVFPVCGTLCAAAGLVVLGQLSTNSSYGLLSAGLFLLGLGLGLLMQVLVLAVQNASPEADLGSATTTASFSRTMGQSFGGAVFGAILANQFNDARAGSGDARLSAPGLKPEGLPGLPEPARSTGMDMFVDSLDVVFIAAGVVMLAAFALSWFLKEMELREIDDLEAIASELDDPTLYEAVPETDPVPGKGEAGRPGPAARSAPAGE